MKKVVLVPFCQDNASTVLAWRNSPRIKDNSLDDSVISQESHIAFLKRLKADRSRQYFVVELGGSPVAVLSFVGLGEEHVVWGCYIGSEKVLPGMFPLLACIGIRYAFRFSTTRYLDSEVAEHNSAPLKLNQFLGVPFTSTIEKKTTRGRSVVFCQFSLPRDEAEKVLGKARKIMTLSMREMLDTFKVKK